MRRSSGPWVGGGLLAGQRDPVWLIEVDRIYLINDGRRRVYRGRVRVFFSLAGALEFARTRELTGCFVTSRPPGTVSPTGRWILTLALPKPPKPPKP